MAVEPRRSSRLFPFATFLILLSVSFSGAPSSTAIAEEKVLTQKQAIAKWGGKGIQAWGLDIREGFEKATTARYLMDGPRISHLCQGPSDLRCDGEVNLFHNLTFDVCTPDAKLACIDSLWAVDSNGSRINGELVRPILFDKQYAVNENIELNLPKSTSRGTIWRLPGVKNSSGTDTYFVATHVTMFKNAKRKAFEFGEINSGIVPVKEILGNYSPMVLSPVWGGSGGNDVTPEGDVCSAVEVGICQSPAEFPNNFSFGMTLKFGERLNGWFHGRLSNPKIAIKDWLSGQEISIEGTPVRIPSLDFVVPKNELSEEQQKLFIDCITGTCGGSGGIDGIAQTGGNLSHPRTMELVAAFSNAYRDRATTTRTNWSFKNMFNHAGSINVEELRVCSPNDGSLTGLVLTNSLTYSSGPPQFDASSGSLIYKVASPHYEENGEVSLGSYDLIIRGSTARCLYKFSNAPIRAEVSITGDQGEKRVATTTLTESGDWLYLAAKGFTFSSPEIRVKLFQDKSNISSIAPSPTPTPSATATPSLTPSATPQVVTAQGKTKRTITCVKGTSKRKITGSKPKCPKGFSQA